MTPQSLGWGKSDSAEGEAGKGSPFRGGKAFCIHGIDLERPGRRPGGGLAQRYKISITCVGSEGWGQKANHLADGRSNLEDRGKSHFQAGMDLGSNPARHLSYPNLEVSSHLDHSEGSTHFDLKGTWGPFHGASQ